MNEVCPFFRVVLDENKEEAVLQGITEYKQGKFSKNVFSRSLESFKRLSGSPFSYWVSGEIIDKISKFPELDCAGATINVGLQTGDDFRFLRNFWEVDPENIKKRFWIPYTKTDFAIPWYSTINLVVKWHLDGKEIKNFSDMRGKIRSRPQNSGYYGRPGFSYMLRSTRLVPYIVPRACIPTAGRSLIYPHQDIDLDVLTLCASNFGSAIARFRGEKFGWPKFQASMVQSIPFTRIQKNKALFLEAIMQKVQNARKNISFNETSPEFLKYDRLFIENTRNDDDFSSFLGKQNEILFAQEFGLSREELTILEHDLQEAVSLRSDQSKENETLSFEDDTIDGPAAFLSYCIGCAYGRWDIRYATGEKQPPSLSDSFAPLPTCPPGALQDDNCLPLMTSPPNYVLNIQWSGILVEDPGHPHDIVQRLREVIRIIYGSNAEDIEDEACSILGLQNLQEYFKRISHGGLWDDHIKRYSKNKRKAPIYWKLTSLKGNFSIWLYYHRITRDTLFIVLNEYINPKIELEEAKYQELRQRKENEKDTLSRSQVTKLSKEIEAKADFINELKNFKEKIEKIAKRGYDPDFDDGVILNMAPLHEVIQLKEPKAYWEDLEKGKYDWAHIAMKYWPDRVKEKCKKDKSLAIAHGMEHLYE